MKTIFRLFCGWMAIALTACNGDELSRVADTQNPDTSRVVSVKAYTPSEQPDSKLAFEEKTDGSLGVSWAAGDAFTVVVGGEEVIFTYDTEKSKFTATLPEGVTLTDGVKAYYPAYTGEYATDLSTQTGKLDSKVTYMEGTYSVSGNSFRFSHSTAILKTSFTGLPGDAVVSSIKVITSPYTISIPFSDGLDLVSGIYIYLPSIAKDDQVMFMIETTAGEVYTATQTVKPAAGIETGKVYNASVTLTEAVCMPEGEVFNAAIKAVQGFESVTSIVFEAQSDETGGTQINTSSAYAKVMTDGTTLKIYTVAKEFVFNTNCNYMFGEMSTITSIDFGICVNTLGVREMNDMFSRCSALSSLNLVHFVTYGITGMNSMFFGCSSLESIIFSVDFNTAKVTDMNGMFAYCSKLTSLDLLNFNTAEVRDMDGMFYECLALTSLDLRHFNFGKVTDFDDMFYEIGRDAQIRPIYVYVNDEATQTLLESKSTGINSSHAKVQIKP